MIDERANPNEGDTMFIWAPNKEVRDGLYPEIRLEMGDDAWKEGVLPYAYHLAWRARRALHETEVDKLRQGRKFADQAVNLIYDDHVVDFDPQKYETKLMLLPEFGGYMAYGPSYLIQGSILFFRARLDNAVDLEEMVRPQIEANEADEPTKQVYALLQRLQQVTEDHLHTEIPAKYVQQLVDINRNRVCPMANFTTEQIMRSLIFEG